jgi:hypothetical protein
MRTAFGNFYLFRLGGKYLTRTDDIRAACLLAARLARENLDPVCISREAPDTAHDLLTSGYRMGPLEAVVYPAGEYRLSP